MRRDFRLAEICCLLLMLVLVSGCGSSSAPPATPTPIPLSTVPPASQFTAALVTDVGGLHDRSFNQLTWEGLRTTRKSLGIRIESKESNTEAAYEPNLLAMARRKPSLIFTVGYSMSRAVYDVAQRYPHQRFAMVDARPFDPGFREVSLPNVENILFKEQEAGYLAGVVAGMMERGRIGHATHNTIGYLGGKAVESVVHYLAGYIAGARKVDPSVRVLGQYAKSFVKPALGRTIGARQIRAGADILFQVAAETGSGYLSAVQKGRVYGIGVDIDQSFLGPFVIASAVKHVNVAVRDVVRSTLRGGFQAGDQRFGETSGAVGLSHTSRLIPTAIVHRVATIELEIRRGTLTPPQSIPAR